MLTYGVNDRTAFLRPMSEQYAALEAVPKLHLRATSARKE